MKVHVTHSLVNAAVFMIIVVVSIMISTISLTRKYNKFQREYVNGVTAVVIKEEISIMSSGDGIVKVVNIQEGGFVKKGDILFEIDNPAIRDKIETLTQFKDNLSAQTEARVAETSLRFFMILSTRDGIVSEVFVNQGETVDATTKLATIYSNNDIQLLADLTSEQYELAQGMNQITAYSPRLNQNFILVPTSIKPEVRVTEENKKKIGLYLVFKNPSDGIGLLQKEDVILRLRPLLEMSRPVDSIANFWNGIFKEANE